MAANKVLLLIGAGSNIGAAVAKKFAAAGYSVVVGSRSTVPGRTADGYLGVRVDAANPADVSAAFQTTHKEVGAPSVVVWNAYSHVPNADPLALTQEEFGSSLTTNILSPFVAMQLAVQSVAKLEEEGSKLTFIYTGNFLNTAGRRMPPLTALGVGKTGAAHLIENVAQVHGGPKAQFYYADERTSDGDAVYGDRNGEAHAEYYFDLVQGTTQGPALATFVKGKGYHKFE